MKILDINNIDHSDWDFFVQNHPNGNFFQTRHFFDLFSKLKNCKPFGYFAFEDNKINGILIGVLYKNYFWPLSTLTKRIVIIGGPLIKDNNNEIFNLLINYFLKKEKNNSIYIQFRNIWDIKSNEFDFEKNGLVFEEHLDIIHDLTLDKDFIISNISKGKRGNINKSKNKGTNFKEISNIHDFRKGVELIISTYKRIGLPCPSIDFFYNIYNLYFESKIIRSFGVFDQDALIAMRIEICFKDTIYDWYTGSDENYNHRYPNDILPYNIILWGKENGFRIFDFGGAGKPNIKYGVRDHKLKFGGELVSFGRYEIVNNRLFMFLFKVGVSIFKK